MTCEINVTAQAQYMYELQTKYISNETNEIQLNTRPSTDQHVQPSNMDLSPAGVNKKPKNSKLSGRVNQLSLKLSAGFSNTVC